MAASRTATVQVSGRAMLIFDGYSGYLSIRVLRRFREDKFIFDTWLSMKSHVP